MNRAFYGHTHKKDIALCTGTLNFKKGMVVQLSTQCIMKLKKDKASSPGSTKGRAPKEELSDLKGEQKVILEGESVSPVRQGTTR